MYYYMYNICIISRVLTAKLDAVMRFSFFVKLHETLENNRIFVKTTEISF